ncbi:MAG TPA: 4a-hydroxytetrahydrobiopterin dehydratase [Planctomycetota bacterium]
MALADQECVPCRGGVPPLSPADYKPLLMDLAEGWEVVDDHHLERVWEVQGFQPALDLVNRCGAVCEAQGHHADFELGWGRVKALIWTHKIDGLTESDFVLAAKFDALG